MTSWRWPIRITGSAWLPGRVDDDRSDIDRQLSAVRARAGPWTLMSGPSDAFALVDDPASNLGTLLGYPGGLRADPVAANEPGRS